MVPAKRKAEQSADALDDGLEYEVDSDAAADLASIQGSESDNDNLDTASTDGDAIKTAEKSTVTTEEQKAVKKARRQRRALVRKRRAEEAGESHIMPKTVLSTDQQGDLFTKLLMKYPPSKDLTSVELADLALPYSTFVDTTSFTAERNLSSVSSFVEKFTKRQDLKSSNKEPGRPHTLIIACSAIRVADLTRSFKYLNDKTSTVVKLFGKEKLSTQAQLLQKTRVSIAVGVPARILALLEEGSMKASRVEQIYVDHSYRDVKERALVQIKDPVVSLLRLLGWSELRERLVGGDCKVLLF